MDSLYDGIGAAFVLVLAIALVAIYVVPVVAPAGRWRRIRAGIGALAGILLAASLYGPFRRALDHLVEFYEIDPQTGRVLDRVYTTMDTLTIVSFAAALVLVVVSAYLALRGVGGQRTQVESAPEDSTDGRQVDYALQIAKLAALREQGLISGDDYERKKQELLDRI